MCEIDDFMARLNALRQDIGRHLQGDEASKAAGFDASEVKPFDQAKLELLGTVLDESVRFIESLSIDSLQLDIRCEEIDNIKGLVRKSINHQRFMMEFVDRKSEAYEELNRTTQGLCAELESAV